MDLFIVRFPRSCGNKHERRLTVQVRYREHVECVRTPETGLRCSGKDNSHLSRALEEKLFENSFPFTRVVAEPHSAVRVELHAASADEYSRRHKMFLVQ